MADNNNEDGNAAAKPVHGAEAKNDAKTDKRELPNVDSPSLSPAGEGEPARAPSTDLVVGADEKISGPSPRWRPRLKARHRRQAVLAASVLAAAAIGAIIGARTIAPGAPTPDPEAMRERAALQQSIAELGKQIAALKANVEAGEKSARNQIAKISERLRAAPETTGSISTPSAAVPMPLPRPAEQAAGPAAVVRDWRIFDVRDGVVAVQGHGDIYEIGVGAPLPGLGPVQEIKRVDGRWVVVTPRGIIVSLRDRRHFER
jgi:hypothetical protein